MSIMSSGLPYIPPLGEKVWFLKQARPYVKIKPDLPFSSTRNFYEYKSIKLLREIWGPNVVPEVLYYDKGNFVMIMKDLKGKGEVLARELKRGIVRPEIGEGLGTLMGILQGKTFGKDIIIRNRKEDQEMREFNYDFRTAGAKKFAPKEVEEIITESKEAKRALIIADPASKNIFVEDNRVRLFDFEGVHMGDPAWDVGFILGHFLLEAGHRPEVREAVNRLVRNFVTNYRQKMMDYGINQEELRGIEKRAVKFMGVTILHRIAGGVGKGRKVYTSYIGGNRLENLENIALQLLKGKINTPEEATLIF